MHPPTRTTTTTRRRRSLLALAAVPIVLGLGGAGCSSSASDGSSGSDGAKKPTTTVALDANCALRQGDAKPLVGSGAAEVDPPKLAGIQPPVARCAYDDGDRMAQLTVFEGPEMATSIASTLLGSDAKKVAALGDGGSCASGKGTEVATATCVWVNDGRSYVLGLTLPLDALEKGTVAKVQTAALAVQKRLPAGATTTATTAKDTTTSDD